MVNESLGLSPSFPRAQVPVIKDIWRQIRTAPSNEEMVGGDWFRLVRVDADVGEWSTIEQTLDFYHKLTI